MASRTVYIAIGIAAVIILAVVAALLSTGGGAARETATTTTAAKKTIKIGVLAPITGQLSSYGAGLRDAVDLAVKDINAMCANAQFQAVVQDTGTNAQRALEMLQNLYAQGVKVVVGPMSSGELSNLMSFAQNYKIILNSPSSTSPALAVEGRKYIFRVVPTDLEQARAQAALLAKLGVKKVYVLYRRDPYGEGLARALTNISSSYGFTVVGTESYDPKDEVLPNSVPSAVSRLSQIVRTPAPDVAVVLVAFETDGPLAIQHASQNPVLSKVRWIGADGVAYSSVMVKQVGSALASLRFMATIAGPDPNDPKYQEFKNKFRSQYGRYPVAYDPYSYDAAMILLQAMCRLGTDDPDQVWSLVMQWGKDGTYAGATGRIFLNAVGDRTRSNYIVGGVKIVNGTPTWVDAAYYYWDTNEVRVFDQSFFS